MRSVKIGSCFSGDEATSADGGEVDIFGGGEDDDDDEGTDEVDMNEYSGEPASCHMPDSERIPCGHQLNTSREYCEGLGCCYNPTRAGSNPTTGMGLPACFHHTGRYRLDMINSNTVNSKFHLIPFFPILWLKCTVNSNSTYFEEKSCR